jgi:hypothetical protein
MTFYWKEEKYMSGINQTTVVKITLRNPLDYDDKISFNIVPHDNLLAQDWIIALKELLKSGNLLEKNFCFMGFPKTARTLPYLCEQVNQAIDIINEFFPDYQIDNRFTPENVIATDYAENGPNHELLNQLHNHFERLQGTVWNLSEYYRRADYNTKYAIRELNNICHEMENLILSQRKLVTDPYWIRPSQITTFLNAYRYDLKDQHKQGFITNGYDRVLGGVYMHWTQIGKTLYEVFRDENAPELTDTVCEAITELRYYSGEFDIEWANDVVLGGANPWHNEEQERFKEWLRINGRNPQDPKLSLGYLPIGQVDLQGSFGTTDYQKIWDILSKHLDIYSIEIDEVKNTFDYCWSDPTYKQMQIDIMKPGYDYSSRG